MKATSTLGASERLCKERVEEPVKEKRERGGPYQHVQAGAP